MAYQGSSEYASLAWRTVRLTFNFKGRSSRSELIAYNLASMGLGLIASLLADLTVPGDLASLVTFGVVETRYIPMYALFVRRARDADWSGWWIAPGLAVGVNNTAMAILARTHGVAARIDTEHALWLLGYIAPIAVIGAMLIMILPGSTGPNRFGPDPRGRI